MPRRKSYEEVKQFFESKGYTLLSTEYINNAQKLHCVCPSGHVCDISYASLRSGHGCAVCAGNKKFSYEYVKEVFEAEGYTLLTEVYRDNKQKLEYICPEGHKGSISFSRFMCGQRCGACAGNRRLSLEEVKKVFELSGYTLVSTEYVNARTPLEYVCPNGHRSSITYDGFRSGNGCRVCAGNQRHTYDSVKYAFEAEGYTLISTEYLRNSQKLEYVCPNGHIGSIRYSDFLSGKRCAVCAGNKKLTYEQVKKAFEDEGYTLLSTEYINSNAKLDYICPEGHKGSIRYNDFNSGQRCGICFGTRKYSYAAVKSHFEKEGYTLLSDEYINRRGSLHYICPEGHEGVTTYGSFLAGHRCPTCAIIANRIPYEQIKQAFEDEGYTLLSTEYKNYAQKLKYICPNGHRGSIRYSSFRKGHRCSVCAVEKSKLPYDKVKDLFVREGYTLLSDVYTGSKDRLEYICPEGHRGSISYNRLQQGKRCSACFGNISRAEVEIRDFVSALVGSDSVLANIRSVIPPMELDIFIPSKKLAIEYCGLYWHSEVGGGKPRNYHRAKMDACLEKGIRLITVFEDEYHDRPAVVKSRIANAVGCVKDRVYARNCTVEPIDVKAAAAFLEQYHLQGSSVRSNGWGLFYDGSLLQVLTIGKVSRAHVAKINGQRVSMYELKRFASVPGVIVVGGAGKLFKAAINHIRAVGGEYIKSYSDNRYANPFSSVYEKLGFALVGETKYTPHYVLNGVRYRNQSLRKTKEERLTGKTEWELRCEQGYDRIWDCGHKTYLYKL